MTCPIVKLGDVSTINPRLPKDTDESQLVSFLPMASVLESGEIVNQQPRILADTKKGFTYFGRNDVLLAKITPCFENGKAAHTSALETEIGYGSTEFHVVRANEKLADGKYLFYLIWNDTFRFHGQHAMKGAAGQKRVSADFLKNLKIPLPPLLEQKKIAAILDAADALRQKDQQLIEHYTRLSQSLFLEMFGDPVGNPMGWVHSKCSCLSEVQGGLQVSAKRKGLPLTIPYLRVANVHRNRLDLSEIKKIDITSAELERVELKRDDLLVVEGHGNKEEIGRVGIWNDSIKPIVHQNHLIRIRANPHLVNPSYLCNYLNSKGGRLHMSRASNTTSGLNTISTKVVKNILCPVPPIELQNQFAQHIKAIEQQKQQAQASLEKSEALFNSLLQRAFKGELTQPKTT